MTKASGKLWWLAGCGCAAVVGLGALAGIGAWLWTGRGPDTVFAGESSYEAVLLSSAGDGASDGQVLLQRLESLGVEGELLEAEHGRIVLRVHGASGPEAVEAVVPRRSLAFHLEAEGADSLMPGPEVAADVGPDLRPDVDHVRNSTVRTWVGPSAESLAPILSRIPAGGGTTSLVECGEADWADSIERECRVRVVEATPLVTGADVVDAEVQEDEAMGPQVLVALSDEAAARFADGSDRGTGRRLAIVVDHEIVSFPVIMERISGGRALITPGPGSSSEQMAYAQSMAAALRSGALASPWEIASVRVVD